MDGRSYGLRGGELTPLDPRRSYKPLDVGNGIVSGTLAPNGRWLSLGTAHPVHGRIVLTTMAPFAGDRFAPADTRAYRAALADPARPSFGIKLLDQEPTATWLTEDAFPSGVVETRLGRLEWTAAAPAGRGGVLQVIRVIARRPLRGPGWSGVMRLGRAEYTQLTPGGSLPPAPSDNHFSMRTYGGGKETVSLIEDPRLDACAALVQFPAYVELPVGGEATIVLAIALGRSTDSTVEEARRLARGGEALLARELAERARLWSGLDLGDDVDRPARRAVSYGIDCAASRVGDAIALLADHEILPLVWTRDAYYVCRALLAVGARDPTLLAVIAGFIRWTFEVAERVDGWWPRASLASGKAKDRAFQLDQQLFPLLLVADAARLAGTGVEARYAAVCEQTIAALLVKRTAFGLIATDETPADDPLAQPYHFSSHVLLWHVLRAFAYPDADEVRDATLLHFTSEGRFAYAVSGPLGSGARHYHDANDFPTVFAPGWGFCSSADPRWRATIDFAWSEANDGYFAGPIGGLGSVHTPHPWPLGDMQEIFVARVLGDLQRERRARERLELVQTWDYLLPEAYDERTGAVASRHWFAWPAAVRVLIDREPMLTAP